MSIKEVKTSIANLKIGMFVSQLDRPWLETPYSLEGLLISSESEIQELAKYCSYVFVDLEQGISPKIQYWAVGDEDEMVLENKKSFILPQDSSKEFKKYRQCVYETTIELTEELQSAKTVFNNVAEKTQRVFEALSKDKQLDLAALKPAVKATVDSIIRNPTAMSLLVQLRKSDDYNYTHALGTSVWCAQFGRHLGLKKHDINTLALGGLLLDVGKLKLPDSLISSPHQYSSNDLEAVKQHVIFGLNIIKKSADNEQDLLEMVASHHERADGSGYQLGLTNKKIPLFGRLAGIVDSYDAMTSKRIHTESTFSPHEAMNELYKMRGKQFQAGLVEQFIQTVGLYPTGSLVELNTGEVAVVTEINDLKRLFPHVMVILDKNKHPYNEFRTIDLSKVTGVKVVLGLEFGAYGIKMEELFL